MKIIAVKPTHWTKEAADKQKGCWLIQLSKVLMQSCPMNNTAKFVNCTLRWKRTNINKTENYKESVNSLNGNNISDYELGYKALLGDKQNGHMMNQPESQVCSIKQSPYRILKVSLFLLITFVII